MPRQIAERIDAIPPLGKLFRERGYAYTSLKDISESTGLGKGSLYNFFPNGKHEMAKAVLDEVFTWFNHHIFEPLKNEDDTQLAIATMFDSVNTFFQTGKLICLYGNFALDSTRDHFPEDIKRFFSVWSDSLTIAFRHGGLSEAAAADQAEQIIIGIQGALVVTRAKQDTDIFVRALDRQRTQAIEALMRVKN